MSLSELLDPTYPPGSLDELHSGSLHIGDRQAPCHAGQMTVRARLDYWTRQGRDAWTVGPEQHTSMWLAGADALVESLPVRDDDAWWRDADAVPVEWHGEEGQVLAGSMMLVERPPTHASRSLAADLFREVWVIGEWTITMPKELAEKYARGENATVVPAGR